MLLIYCRSNAFLNFYEVLLGIYFNNYILYMYLLYNMHIYTVYYTHIINMYIIIISYIATHMYVKISTLLTFWTVLSLEKKKLNTKFKLHFILTFWHPFGPSTKYILYILAHLNIYTYYSFQRVRCYCIIINIYLYIIYDIKLIN